MGVARSWTDARVGLNDIGIVRHVELFLRSVQQAGSPALLLAVGRNLFRSSAYPLPTASTGVLLV